MPKNNQESQIAFKVILVLLCLALLSSFFAIVNAGERGVLMRFGAVQDTVLSEGIHPILPIVYTVEKLSVRVQSQEISAEASSRDLQNVYADVALNWHIIPTEAHRLYQEIGNKQAVIERIISPAVEEVLKAVMAKYTAEAIVTERGTVKAEVDQALTKRLQPYHIAVDDLSLVHIKFSERFREAVEAKQVAEQEAKRAEFVALRAVREAEAIANRARGEAAAQQLLQPGLTPEILQRQAIEKWNGNLPLIVGGEGVKLFDLKQLVETGQK
ncbi:prohibitin family protein [Leptolyngbya sp. NIES-2104]|uniref:prohibitin family protein n=1 Tax=Leptolyngbya sp. NIES-2104 TaxID=1552121 RepID=UPI00073F63C6|nr:prohibitin family protein [Leptolyngbya sp. NIES-2104]